MLRTTEADMRSSACTTMPIGCSSVSTPALMAWTPTCTRLSVGLLASPSRPTQTLSWLSGFS
ncbi:hypothetical protein ADK59_30510 [Streptomyces sp. XY332]|nr:hypothetical protein ADK59_30510 [Streptomyces sp. XY332]